MGGQGVGMGLGREGQLSQEGCGPWREGGEGQGELT